VVDGPATIPLVIPIVATPDWRSNRNNNNHGSCDPAWSEHL